MKQTNGRDASKAKHRVTAAIPVQKTAGALTNSPAEPVFCTEAAHCSKARGSKLAKSGTVEANAGDVTRTHMLDQKS